MLRIFLALMLEIVTSNLQAKLVDDLLIHDKKSIEGNTKKEAADGTSIL